MHSEMLFSFIDSSSLFYKERKKERKEERMNERKKKKIS